VFCGVHIPKANRCIEQHTNGAKHKDNVELMKANGVRYNNDTLFCKPCKMALSLEDSVLKHIESDGHSNWIAAMEDLTDGEFINMEPFLTSDEDDVHCEVCRLSFHCSLQNIEAHVNGINHRTNITERLKPMNGIFPVDNDDEVWCKVCNVYIDNTARSILDHIDDDDQHMQWFASIEDITHEQSVTFESYLVNEFDLNAYCNKCHVEIPCNIQSLENHVTSENHLNHFS
jgi:hypothetical protein